MAERRRESELVKLHCARCGWSTDLPMAQMGGSCTVPCAHCSAALYWHRCNDCALCYAGDEAPKCPICDGDALDDFALDG